MRFINNEARQVEIRKLQNTLVVVGSGTIIFSLWTLIKFIGTFIILRKETVAGVIADNQAELAGTSDTIIFWVLGFFMTIFMGVVALLHIFTGAVSILRANESRRYGARWRMKMAFGVTNVLLAVAVVVGTVVFREPFITVGIYGAGLIYSAVLRIASAFKRTDIVYIQ